MVKWSGWCGRGGLSGGIFMVMWSWWIEWWYIHGDVVVVMWSWWWGHGGVVMVAT